MRAINIGKNYFKDFIWRSHDLLSRVFSSISRISQIQTDRWIIIIKIDAIGDFILWLDSAQHYRKIYPPHKYKIALICSEALVPIANLYTFWDKIIPFNKNDFLQLKKNNKICLYRWQLIQNIGKRSYEVLVHPTHSREYYWGDMLSRIIPAKIKIAPLGDTVLISSYHKAISDRWYDRLIELPRCIQSEIVKNIYFINQIGDTGLTWSVPSIPTTEPFRSESSLYCVIFPGASAAFRRWPAIRFAEICNRIIKSKDISCIICGSLDEFQVGEEIIKNIDCKKYVKNLMGQTSLIEFIEIVRSAKFLIGNESSGPLIALSVATPSICILGGGHFERFAPLPDNEQFHKIIPNCVYHKMSCYYCDWKCIYEEQGLECWPCISMITVEQVWGAVDLFQ